MSTAAPRTALVVRGGLEAHEPVQTTELFIPFLEANGYSVRVEESPAVYADADYLAGVDLIVQCVTMGSAEPSEVAGLIAAVRAGTGLAGWHGGIVDSYRDDTNYLQLTGGQFVSHPTRYARWDGPGFPDCTLHYTVAIAPDRAEHPIVAGIGDFELDTEQYWVFTDDYNDVLATTTLPVRDFDAWDRPVTCPVVWTRQWGAGRVFVATPGHALDVFDEPSLRTIVERGLLWASR